MMICWFLLIENQASVMEAPPIHPKEDSQLLLFIITLLPPPTALEGALSLDNPPLYA